ncbi:cell division protein FtsQ/DivIB [candidate division KSB1 bacterium]
MKKLLRFLKRLVYFCAAGAGIYFTGMWINHWVHNSDTFLVTHVEVEGAKLLSEENILALVKLEPNVRIFDIDVAPYIDMVKSNPYVEKVSIGKKLPQTIKIDLEERVPVAIIDLYKDCLTDKNGYLLPKLKNIAYLAELPVITGVSLDNPKTGEKSEDEPLIKSLDFINILNEEIPFFSNSISEIHYENEEISVYLSDHGTMIKFGEDGYSLKIQKLIYFLEHYQKQNEISNLIYIDLNYKDQIVVREVNSGQ